MRRYTAFLLLVIFVYSCAGKTKYPNGIIKQPLMQEVLWDMLQADGVATEMVKKDSSLKLTAENIKLYRKVFLAHKISKAQFEVSYSFYQQHPDLMKVLLDSMNAQRNSKADKIHKKIVLSKIDSSKI